MASHADTHSNTSDTRPSTGIPASATVSPDGPQQFGENPGGEVGGEDEGDQGEHGRVDHQKPSGSSKKLVAQIRATPAARPATVTASTVRADLIAGLRGWVFLASGPGSGARTRI